MKKLTLLFLAIIIFGCSAQEKHQIPDEIQNLENLTVFSSTDAPRTSITFKRKAVYGNSEEVLIGRIGDIAVDSLGRVFIADVQKKVIHVFDQKGRLIDQLGREGRGPGEFGNIKSLQIRGEQLFAYDSYQNKVNIFPLDTLSDNEAIIVAKNRREYQALKATFPSIDELYVRKDHTFLAKFRSLSSTEQVKKWQNVETKGLLYLLDTNGDIISKQLEFISEISTNTGVLIYTIKQYFGKTLISISKNDIVYLIEPKHFLIKKYSPDGDYHEAFYYPIERVLLTEEKAKEGNIPFEYLEDIDHPENFPAVTDLKIDDQDRIWIATTVEDMKVFEWWVLEETGELITKFEWPRDQPIKYVRGNNMYVMQSNDRNSVENIVQYQFEFEE